LKGCKRGSSASNSYNVSTKNELKDVYLVSG